MVRTDEKRAMFRELMVAAVASGERGKVAADVALEAYHAWVSVRLPRNLTAILAERGEELLNVLDCPPGRADDIPAAKEALRQALREYQST